MHIARAGSLVRTIRSGIDAVDDPHGVILVSGTDGEIVSDTLNTLFSSGATFITDGAAINDFVHIASNYYIISAITQDTITTTTDMSSGSSIHFTVTHRATISTGTDGVVITGDKKTITSAGSDFVSDGVASGDFVKIGSTYYVVDVVTDLNNLKVTVDMTVGTGISFTVLHETILSTKTNGEHIAVNQKKLISETSDFVTAGIAAGDEINIGGSYYTVTDISTTYLLVSSNMSGGAGVSFKVVREFVAYDLTGFSSFVLLVHSEDDVSSGSIGIEIEQSPTTTYRSKLGSDYSIGFDASHGYATVVSHGGSFVRARVNSLTADGNIDVYLIGSRGIL